MKKRILLISSMLAIIICVALIVGSTLALLTSEDRIHLSVSSGSLEVSADLTGFTLYSAVPDDKGELEDEHGRKYSYESYTDGRFKNGGTASADENGVITFENLTPGDKVVFVIEVTNKGSLRAQYKTLFKLVDQEINKLYDALDFKVGVGEGDVLGDLNGDIESITEDVPTYQLNSITTDTGWKILDKEKTETIAVSIGLPLNTGNNYQNVSAKLSCTLCALQRAVDTAVSGIAEVQGKDVMDLEEAVSRALDGDVIEIVRGNITPPSRDITIDKNLIFKSADGRIYPFKDVHFNVINGVTLSIADMQFTGDTWMNISDVNEFELKNCVFNAAPSKIFDEANREPLKRAAVIASNETQQSGVILKIEGNSFAVADGALADTAAIFMGSAIADGSYIKGNTFGSKDREYDASAIELLNVSASAELAVENNKVYGHTALKLDQNVNRGTYTVNLKNNTCVSALENARYIELVTDNRIELYDNGSTFNAESVSFNNLYAPNGGLFFGIDVELDDRGDVLRGKFLILTDSITDEAFKGNFVSYDADEEEIEIFRATA